jgi:hypothetical protein
MAGMIPEKLIYFSGTVKKEDYTGLNEEFQEFVPVFRFKNDPIRKKPDAAHETIEKSNASSNTVLIISLILSSDL